MARNLPSFVKVRGKYLNQFLRRIREAQNRRFSAQIRDRKYPGSLKGIDKGYFLLQIIFQSIELVSCGLPIPKHNRRRFR